MTVQGATGNGTASEPFPVEMEGSSQTDEAPVAGIPTAAKADPVAEPELLETEILQPIEPGSLPEPASRVNLSFELSKGMRIRVTVEALPAGDEADLQPVATTYVSDPADAEAGPVTIALPVYPPQRVTPPASRAFHLGSALRAWPFSLEATLFGLALLVYLSTRLIGLTRFPIYFFTDEAAQTVLASDLVHNHWKNYAGEFLPTFFENGGNYRLGTSVYLQVIPTLIFGKSAFVTRATSALVTFFAALAVGLMLRGAFRLRYWWSATLLLSLTPAWFLHSRTAFEAPAAVSFYALFLYFYLQYRCKNPRYLYPALLAGALAFYTYSPMQIVMAASGVLLALSDARYHWQNRRTSLPGLVLLAVLMLPYARFLILHHRENYENLIALDSYWIKPAPLADKLRQFAAIYLHSLSPGYWFNRNTGELERHLMKGYGHLLLPSLPFLLLGLVYALRRWRSPAYRVALVALLSAPAGAALVQVGITRALAVVIPATLLAAIGVALVMGWLERRGLSRQWLSLGLFAILALGNFGMLRDAQVNGPTWYENYGMGGMQYGAFQVFPAIQETLRANPGLRIIFSPNWANGTDVVARFFLSDPLPVQMASIQGYMMQHLDLNDQTLFILTPEEYQAAYTSGKFTGIQVERILPYPDGQPGFYFLRLRYVDHIDAILAADREARRQLQEAELNLSGEPVKVRYSMLDIGQIENALDGNPDTLARTFDANPFVVELNFPRPHAFNGLSLKIGSTEAQVTARLYASEGASPVEFSEVITGTVENQVGVLHFGRPVPAQILNLQIQDLRQTEPGHVHVWEITLLK